MSDILFVFPTNNNEYSLSIAIISGVIKQNGFSSCLFTLDFRCPSEDIDAELVELMRNNSFMLIAISLYTNYWKPIDKWLYRIKELSTTPILVGGWHPTLVPEDTLAHPSIDFICIGEGEFPTFDLLQAIKEGKRTDNIQNIWLRSPITGEIIKNSLRPPIPDLDVLPKPDYELFDFQSIIDRRTAIILGPFGAIGAVPYSAGRGCAYHCNYCCNDGFQKRYGLLPKKFIRRRSVSVVMNDLEHLVRNYDVKWIEFWDEDITLDKEWFDEFIRQYPNRISLPFSVNARPNNVQEDQLQRLAKIDCKMVVMGVECGNEHYRITNLKRNVTNQQIINAFSLARENGIMTVSSNIVGMPFETEKEITETLDFNELLAPDFFSFFIYNPFKGTELFRIAEKAGLLDNDYEFMNYSYEDGGYIKGIDKKTFDKLFERYVNLNHKLMKDCLKRYPNYPNVQPKKFSKKGLYSSFKKRVNTMLELFRKKPIQSNGC